jgi:hypothetical protein
MRESMRNLSPKARTRLGWLLAPVLAGLAVLLQYIVDVPKGEILGRESPATAGDSDGDSVKRNGERPRKSKSKKPKPKPKSKPRQSKPKPRTPAQLKQLRAEWSDRPFEDEPIDQAFRRQQEALLRSVATRARTDVLGEREMQGMQIRPMCRTLRCALELCGDKTLVGGIAELLPHANVGGVSLWHELREVEPTRQTPKRDSTKDHVCRRWIVDFALENAEVGKVTLDGGAP